MTYAGKRPQASYTVTLSYIDKRTGERHSKTFTCQYAAKAFYIKKHRQGADPQFVHATVDHLQK